MSQTAGPLVLNTHTPPPAPVPNPTPGPAPATPEDRVKEELKKLINPALGQSDFGGSSFGTFNCPGRQVAELEVTSWPQVALVLERLQKGAEIRLTFPEVTPPANVSEISQEQKEIHSFLATRHNYSVKETANLLVDKIAKSRLFKDCPPASAEKLARGWVDGRLLNPLNTDCVSVSHVYNPETLKGTHTSNNIADMVAKLTAAPTHPRVIFEVPIDKSDTNAVKAVATDLRNAISGNTISAAYEVWVGNGKSSPATDILAFTYDNFIAHYVDGKPAVTIPYIAGGTPPAGGGTSPAPGGTNPAAGGTTPAAGSRAWSAVTTLAWYAWQPVRWIGSCFRWMADF